MSPENPWKSCSETVFGNLCSDTIACEGLANTSARQPREAMSLDDHKRPCRFTYLCVRQPYGPSRVVELDLTIRRLVTSAVRDAVTKSLIDVGPPVDDEPGWREYRRARPDRRYAVAKRALSRRELRRHGLSNLAEA